MDNIVKLLKGIYLEVTSIALILIGYIISGGEYNGVTSTFFIFGVIMLFIGILVGIGGLIVEKEKEK